MWVWWLQSAGELCCGLHSQGRRVIFRYLYAASPVLRCPYFPRVLKASLFNWPHALPHVTSKSDLYWLNPSSIITGSCMCNATVGNPSGIPSSRCFIWVYDYWSLIFRVSLWGSTTPFLIEDSVLIFYLKLRACYYSAFNILIHT